MVIPSCHSGMIGRGSEGGVCEQRQDDGTCLNIRGALSPLSYCEEEDPNDCNFVDMRGCDDNDLFKEYSATDIIISDDDNRCNSMVPDYSKDKSDVPYTHQAVIVGWGT
jgi:hypothetical protein